METLSCNDVISCLWSSSAVEKCRLGIADVIIYEGGHPARYYVTGANGEVKLKRNIDMSIISRRWISITEQVESNYIAVIRQDDGLLKYLTRDAWDRFLAEPVVDKGIQSVHCFLSSGHNVLYRCTYQKDLSSGRYKTANQVYSIPNQEPLHVSYESKIKLTDSRAGQINKVVDLATTTVVKYVEKMLRINLSEFIVDYVIDKKSQIWMMWSSRAEFDRSRPLTSPEKGGHLSTANNNNNPYEYSDQLELQESANNLSRQLTTMSRSSASRRDPYSEKLKVLASSHSFSVSHDRPPSPNSSNYPQPFSCHGEYCQLDVKSTGKLSMDSSVAGLHMAQRLFTEDEISRLRKDTRFNKMMEFGSSGVGLAEISMKSIVAARKEQRGVDAKNKELSLDTQASAKVASPEKSFTDRMSSPKKKGIAKSEDDPMPDNIATHYEHVRVCGVCYDVYQCLDWARDLLAKSDNSFRRRGRDRTSSSISSHQLSNENTFDGSKSLDRSSQPRSPSSEGQLLRSKTTKDLRSGRNATWKSRMDQASPTRAEQRATLAPLENYLRGEIKQTTDRGKSYSPESKRGSTLNESSLNESTKDLTSSSATVETKESNGNFYFGHVLLACSDEAKLRPFLKILDEGQFRVTWVRDGREASNMVIESWNSFDCIVMERDLQLVNAFELAKVVRDHEKEVRNIESGKAPKEQAGKFLHHRIPLICYTSATSPNDLAKYMRADMDGCISHPLERMALVNTIRAAIPHHLAPIRPLDKPVESHKQQGKVQRIGLLGELENSVDSASMALKTMSMPKDDTGAELQGVAQLDADTKIPFLVINGSKFAQIRNVMSNKFFNLVVCHDIFDTFERMKILLQPIVQRYQGIQVLVWNYPGQAHTEWRKSQVLSNEYLAACLNEVLGQVGEHGTKDFATDQPFYIMGYGYGANIAATYLANYRVNNCRGLLSVNGWAYVDSYLAGVMHDCMNIFKSAPEARPDLPVYFFSRFLFCKDYLAKVSVPLALNIYTAVYNAITIAGRNQLCNGVLQSVDIRPLLKAIDVPLICLHSNQDSFARPMHVDPFVSLRGGEVRSIYKALEYPTTTCVVWFSGGHEIFQENRKQILLLLEQILTGYHEVHEITFPSAAAMHLDTKFSLRDQFKSPAATATAADSKDDSKLSLEDKFTKSILNHAHAKASNSSTINTSAASSVLGGSVRGGRNSSPTSDLHTATSRPSTHESNRSMANSASGPSGVNASTDSWQDFSGAIITKQHNILTMDAAKKLEKSQKAKSAAAPEGSLPYLSDAKAYPEVKEYMAWRLKRNKKRLQRLQLAAQTIQSAFRAYMARILVQTMRKRRAALLIQRTFRGWRGRKRFYRHVRRIWAAMQIQRAFRGFYSRKWYFIIRLKIASAANIQRVFRGFCGRQRVKAIRRRQNAAACVMQAMFRRYKARREVWLKRRLRNCAITIQRIFRGYLGKMKSQAERDKYIFSKSQSQGIEFGRQMLLEHKLHVTKLQSDVTLLTQDKVVAEEQIEALLEEISSFEEGVRNLEKEMHQLSKVEAEAAAFMDEDSRFELREQKMRLDREFGEMLSKIANRKDMLSDLEKKLSSIDKIRQGKEEDLRTLERKLVVLLEDQQKELAAIRRKQDVRGALLAASHAELSKVTAGSSADGSAGSGGGGGGGAGSMNMIGNGGGGGGGSSGPSLQEKKQAAQLMQSTETLMKFGFMSMSMTYFSSLNMIKALRTVSAQDTVMAALADVHAQRAVGAGGGGGGGGGGGNALAEKEAGVARLKAGQLPGQQQLQVTSWSVDDVAKWLQTLSLGQYSESFIDAAVDGEFLYDLNDDDLKNTLGIEHRLHRKKILNCVNRLKMAEAQNEARLGRIQAGLNPDGQPFGAIEPNGEVPGHNYPSVDSLNFPNSVGGANDDDRSMSGPKVPVNELFSIVRHSKFAQLKDAIDYLPNKLFDITLVQSGYAPDHGTVYLAGYERLPFHCNKTDEHGNSLLSLAAQNGNLKICKYLIAKGANPNHQNKQGQSPAHFAIAYKFFELSQWLFANGADDGVENKFGLTPYDGLSTEGPDEEMLAIEGF